MSRAQCYFLGLFLFLGWEGDAFSEQLLFKKSGDHYHYRWQPDAVAAPHDMEFQLNRKKSELSRFIQYKNQNRLRYVEQQLRRYARSFDPKRIRFEFIRLDDRLRIEMDSREPQLLDEAQTQFARVRAKAEQEYLNQHYYMTFTDPLGREVIKPDHKRIMADSIEELRPLSEALSRLFQGSSLREQLSLLLGFVQSIPYDPLYSLDRVRGSGFLMPGELLAQNRGDCDSKSVLLLTLLKALYPKLTMVMVFIPDHALIGIAAPTRESDQTLDYDGIHYLLMEVSGPAYLPLGQIAEKSWVSVSNRMISVESF